MTAWTQVTGYPIVTVELVKEENDQKTFKLTQYVSVYDKSIFHLQKLIYF